MWASRAAVPIVIESRNRTDGGDRPAAYHHGRRRGRRNYPFSAAALNAITDLGDVEAFVGEVAVYLFLLA